MYIAWFDEQIFGLDFTFAFLLYILTLFINNNYYLQVRFCSDDCRVEAWERFHKVECQQLDLILDPTVGKMGMLAMRILTSSGKIYLEYVITKVREEMEARQDPQESPRHIGFNEEGVYDAADYRTVYTLVTNWYGKWEYEM